MIKQPSPFLSLSPCKDILENIEKYLKEKYN